jgi:hypothetical protein
LHPILDIDSLEIDILQNIDVFLEVVLFGTFLEVFDLIHKGKAKSLKTLPGFHEGFDRRGDFVVKLILFSLDFDFRLFELGLGRFDIAGVAMKQG